MQQLAGQANYASWARAREAIEQVVDVVQRWPTVANRIGVGVDTTRLVMARLEEVRVANRVLFGS